MTTDEIWKAILNDPESDQLRLDYANTCIASNPDRAEFIQLQIQSRNLLRLNGEWTGPYGAAYNLLDKPGNKRRWAGPIVDRVNWYDFWLRLC
jgi:hypothetical protein